MLEKQRSFKSPSITPVSKWDLYNQLFTRFPQLYRRIDTLLHLIVFGVIALSIFVLYINHFFYHFTVLPIPMGLISAVPGVIIVYIVGALVQPRYSRVGLFLSSLAQMYCYFIVCVIAITAIITTPNHTIDNYLLKIDQMVGFSTLGLMGCVHQFPLLVKSLQDAYASLYFQLFFTPLILALFNNRREIDRYLLSTFIGLIVAGLIYYLWPTIAPAGVLHSKYFLQNQYDLVQRFVEVHQGAAVTVFDGGLIAFPSAHVMSALVIMFAWRQYKWIFYPLLLVNVVMIFATMALGYHYLTDVIAGAVLAYVAIKISVRCIR